MIAIAALAGVLSGCAGSGTGDGSGGGGGGGGNGGSGCQPPAAGSETVRFKANIQPIYDRSCAVAGCHSPPANQGSLNLSAGKAYRETVNVNAAPPRKQKLVIPGDPDGSYLVQKIEDAPGITGTIMPQGCDAGTGLNGATCLSAGDMAAIRQWIVECAQNN